MTDTLASLRAEAQRTKPTKADTDTFILRAWRAGYDSRTPKNPPELVGCGDNSCIVAKPTGMATNGGCRCDEQRLKRAVMALRQMVISEGDRRAEDMRADCVNALLTERIKYEEDGEGYNVLGDAIDAIRSLPLEKK